MTSSLMLLANMGPPTYFVQIPLGEELRYRFAAPVFLSLAVVSFGVWAARSRAFRRGSDRALLLGCAGALVVSYSAAWVWRHRDNVERDRGPAAILAVEMPWLWVQFCILMYLMTRIYVQKTNQSNVENSAPVPGPSPWLTNVLAVLLAVATVVPVVLAGHHALFLPFMFMCWVLAFVTWNVLRLMAWFVNV